jgi:hypothetical protein
MLPSCLIFTGKFATNKEQIELLTSWKPIYDNYKQVGLLDTTGKQFKLGTKSTSEVQSRQGRKVTPFSNRGNDKSGSGKPDKRNEIT